jgi:phospholipid N-methyltransferase
VATAAVCYANFLIGALTDFQAVSSLTPSSASLARAIAEKVDIKRDGLIIELGPGTGVVTRALLARDVAPHRRLLIESGAHFTKFLSTLFPSIAICQGDALSFEKYLPPKARTAAIVSGLPLLSVDLRTRQAFIGRALACQDEEGVLIQLSYGWRPPARPEPETSIRQTVVWSNFPPAHIWTYQRVRRRIDQGK